LPYVIGLPSRTLVSTAVRRELAVDKSLFVRGRRKIYRNWPSRKGLIGIYLQGVDDTATCKHEIFSDNREL
jgi:hypothetical protein